MFQYVLRVDRKWAKGSSLNDSIRLVGDKQRGATDSKVGAGNGAHFGMPEQSVTVYQGVFGSLLHSS